MGSPLVVNTFAKGTEGWCSYDYDNHCMGGSGFIMARWVPLKMNEFFPSIGFHQSAVGMIMTNCRQWSPDDPEKGLVLPLLHYRHWESKEPFDITDRTVYASLALQGREEKEVKVGFWVLGPEKNVTRWHVKERATFTVHEDAQFRDYSWSLSDASWHSNWNRELRSTVEETLVNVGSYGFSIENDGVGAMYMNGFAIE